MTADIPQSAMRLLHASFDPVVVRRALEYVEEGRVHLVKPPPWPVVARVSGREGYVVTVKYLPSGFHLRGECSCLVEIDCKHAAAAALVALLREADAAGDQALATRQVVVGDWLADLGRKESEAAAKPVRSAGKRVVAYLLDDRDDTLSLTVMHCSRLSTGQLSAGQVMAGLGDPQRGAPRWVNADDLRRIAMLRAVTRAAPMVTKLPIDRLDETLLRDLAESGQLYWRSTSTAPLEIGPPQQAKLAWLPAAEEPDSFRLGLPDSDRIILPASTTHYLSESTGQFGALDLGIAPGLVQRLLVGPPVPSSMRGVVERSLAPLLKPRPVSKRVSLDDEPNDDDLRDDLRDDLDDNLDDELDDDDDVVDETPLITPAPATAWQPALGNDSGEPHVDVSEGLRPHLLASLDRDGELGPAIALLGEASYGDVSFPLGEWDPARPATRDLVAEGRFGALLTELPSRLPSGGRPATSVELLADARYVAEVLVPKLRSQGWRCTLSNDFPHETPLDDVEFIERLTTRTDGRDWFGLELGVVIAGRTVPLLPILLQAIRAGRLVLEAGSTTTVAAGLNLRLPDGELVHVPAARVQRWLRPLLELELTGLARSGELVVPALVAAQFADEEKAASPSPGEPAGKFDVPAALAEARGRLESLIDLQPRDEPKDFGGTLRPYQRLGLAWLHVLHDAGYGGLLADDMGLGKTVQVLAFLDGLRGKRQLSTKAPALVVAPRSVVGNWAAEAKRFAPKLKPIIHLGSGRADEIVALQKGSVVITSYQTMVRDLEMFKTIGWSTLIFDEAQALKNPDTQVRDGAATLVARSRFCITGTPIENHLGELWSQLDLAMPGFMGRRRSFDAVFRRPIEKHGDEAVLERLRQRIRPFLLRRTKAVVEVDLPPKTEIVESVELDTAQRDLYESLRLTLDGEVRAALAQAGVGGAQMVILEALLTLRQCCCDPRLVKLAAARRTTSSAKLERLMAMLEELADAGRSVLVFSQFTSMLTLIEEACQAAGLRYVTLTGKTRDRETPVAQFQAGEAPIFLISLKAGGVGLNLTRADTVIHYDPWWNPAAEAQATDRAHRIGQDKPVMVYKLVARGTLEEAICKMQDEKRRLTNATLKDGGVSSLGATDLEALYRRVV